ncbi:MAG TPA: ABC transporter permease [Mollicutes bacterium]|nr:ABC transporter permease [Mollicutes bacterium]
MKNLYLLLKTRLLNTYNIKKLLNVSKKRMVIYIAIVIYVITTLFISVYEMVSNVANALNEYHLITYMPVLFYLLSTFMVFMFTTYNAKGSMFNSKDNDLLFSMPIKHSDILGSRLIYVYLWNLMTSLFFIAPTFIVYAIKVDVPFIYYIYAFIIFILLPIIPTILASVIGMIIAYLTSKTSRKNWVELILYFLFIALIYYVIGKSDVIINYIVRNSNNLEQTLKLFFYPLYLVYQIIASYDIVSLIIFVILNIGLFSIFTYILSINYKKIIVKLQEEKTRSNYVMKELKSSSILKNLYFKEVKRYFSSPIYVLNTSFGLILILIASIASVFYDKEQILVVFELSTNGQIFNLLVVAIIFIAFVSNTTSSSISIEGKNLWILKTIPVRVEQIFKGKLLLNISLLLPYIYISLIVLYFTIGLTLVELLILSLIATLSSFASAQFGLLVNLKFPKMDAVSDVVIVKRSASAIISVLFPIAFIMISVLFYPLVDKLISFNILLIFIIILLSLINFVEHYLLNTWGIKQFNKIV